MTSLAAAFVVGAITGLCVGGVIALYALAEFSAALERNAKASKPKAEVRP